MSGGQLAFYLGVTGQRISTLEESNRDERGDRIVERITKLEAYRDNGNDSADRGNLVERVTKLEAYWDNLKSIIDRIDRRLDMRSPG